MKCSHLVQMCRLSTVLLTLVVGLEIDPSPARAQMVDNGVISGFEISPAGSLEWEILDRLSATRQYQPGDLPRLARLTVLESIAMYENLRSNLRETSIGARLEGEMSQLWDAAELFSISANYPPPDLAGMSRSRAMLGEVNSAFIQLDSTLGRLTGTLPGASLHFQDIARMLPIMNAMFEAIDAEAARPVPMDVSREANLVALRDQLLRLDCDLRKLIADLNSEVPPPSGRQSLVEDLYSLIDLLKGLDRTTSSNPSNKDLEDSLRVVRRRVWNIEARIVSIGGLPALRSRWRYVRQRIDAVSDQFGLPRVISLSPTVEQVVGVDRKRIAQIDQSLVALDEFLSKTALSLRGSDVGTEFEIQVGRMRLDLLQLRQRVLANEPKGRLSLLLREIELTNQHLIGRAIPDARITRGSETLKIPGYLIPSQAVTKLSDPVPKS